MKNEENAKIPEFGSLEEEREYWEARGPLAEGHKGRLNKPKAGQKRSSFLAVRLTGEELAKLRMVAADQGVGPSTFARLVLTRAIENADRLPKRVTIDELKDALANTLPQPIREKAEALVKDIAVGDPENRSLLIIDSSQKKAFEEFTVSWLAAVLALAGVQVVTPESEEYATIKSAVKLNA
jgi:hypothetical protein